VLAAAREAGLREQDARERADANGDVWVSLLMTR
jgi:hypothetical protein